MGRPRSRKSEEVAWQLMYGPAPDVVDAFERLQVDRHDLQSGKGVVGRLVSRDALRAILPALGITRVGDLTQLDNLSIPVWFAARPASRSLCVSNGKGMTEDIAWLSAVMESAEQAVAEQAAHIVAVVDTPAGLARRGLRSVPLERQPRCAARHLADDREIAWVKGLCWSTGEPVYSPYELVGMDMVSNAPWNTRQFRMASVGLASGGDLFAAALHGLRELIEDDAMFGPLTGGVTSAPSEPLALSLGCGDLWQTISTLAEHGVDCLFTEVGDGIIESVVITALRPMAPMASRLAYFCGSACRATREDAALAGLLEAVQSRLTYISGARDDILPGEYGRGLKPGTEALFGSYRWVDHRAGSANATATVDTLAAKLLAAGSEVYVFPLGGSGFGFEVVRVLADDLVSLHAPPDYVRHGRAGLKLLRTWGLG